MTATANSYMSSYSSPTTSAPAYVLRHNIFGGLSFMYRFSSDNYEKPKNIDNPVSEDIQKDNEKKEDKKDKEKKDEGMNLI